MKKLILAFALVGLTGSVLAQVNLSNKELGSGTPGKTGYENAVKWDNNIFHAPQYMPGNPTAATIYPRVVNVECTKASTGLNCKGYNWLPELGRGEYLMVTPVVVEEPKPVIQTVVVPGPTVFKEVAPKPKKE